LPVKNVETLHTLVTYFDRDGVSTTLKSVTSYINNNDKIKATILGKKNTNKVKVGHIGVLVVQLLLNEVFRVSKVDKNEVHVKLKLSGKRKENGDESKVPN
jgi:hypothetical protein